MRKTTCNMTINWYEFDQNSFRSAEVMFHYQKIVTSPKTVWTCARPWWLGGSKSRCPTLKPTDLKQSSSDRQLDVIFIHETIKKNTWKYGIKIQFIQLLVQYKSTNIYRISASLQVLKCVGMPLRASWIYTEVVILQFKSSTWPSLFSKQYLWPCSRTQHGLTGSLPQSRATS